MASTRKATTRKTIIGAVGRTGPLTEVRDTAGKWLATFTRGAYTVVLAGPRRRFAEGTASVTHARWVRTCPRPFAGRLPRAWLERAIAANQARVPDVLALAMQYIRSAPAILEGGLQVAGDARYGPGPETDRQEGADFNDYLGATWSYPDDPADAPEPDQFRCLDCSGYLRMVWGYRHHLPGAGFDDRVPLGIASTPDRRSIPRRAFQIYDSAPGILVLRRGESTTDLSRLDVGDLVFFDADAGDGPQIDHVGMYLGRDQHGHYRFISSRKRRNGPTLGDYHGASVLDGTGLYARAFCGVRRI
jgi:cell wall-associated NlpC family hydrolase